MPAAGLDLLAPDGPLARLLGQHHENRPEQIEMARRVARTLDQRGKLLVEAGTGTGKSFAYLAPAIERITEHNERVVIATNTIALQEQLITKDVPLLERAASDDRSEPAFRAELVKGRGNYVSVRRLELASRRADRLFSDAASRRSLATVEDWAYRTDDGSLATLPVLERPAVWDRVQSDAGNCMGRRCPRHDQCFYQAARRRMERADLLICNHALFFSDLALRSRGVGFLPTYDHVILDEAHNVEDVASEHFGVSLAEGRVIHLLSLLYTAARAESGFLATLRNVDEEARRRAIQRALDAAGASERFFERAADLLPRNLATRTLTPDDHLENPLTPAFSELAVSLRRLREHCDRDEDRFELNAFAERAAAVADDAEILVEQSLEGCAYWIEGERRARGLRVTVACSPVEVAPILREHLFEQDLSVVLTSATLTTAGGSFEHAVSRLGCDDADTLVLGSPFDHAALVELHVDRHMPDPRDNAYNDALAARVLHHVEATDGGAFVLFTSFNTMHQVERRTRDALESQGRTVLVQGRDGPRSHLLEAFRNDERAVLLGTASFWQGVDVRGRALRNVIITRLPFDPPDRPLTEARLRRIEERGGNPFMDDSLPRAVIRFKQGFGRLIRSATDQGRVVVLDKRIATKHYGRAFLAALPEGVRVVHAPAPAPHAET